MNPEWHARSADRDAQTDPWAQPGTAAAYRSDNEPDDAPPGWDAPDPASMSTQPLTSPPGQHPPAVPHQPTGVDEPYPGQPAPARPFTHSPAPGQPVSGDPFSGQPVSGDPFSGQPAPGGGYPDVPDPLFPDDRASWQPRIVPSPPPQRGKVVLALLVGLLSGLLVFGLSGFFLGRWTAGDSGAAPTPQPTGTGDLPAYERSQLTLNGAKFTGALAALAEPWLPFADGCRKNGDPEGPRLNPGEAARVRCEYSSMSLYFVEYSSVAEREKIRIRNLGQNVDAQRLTPGVEPTATDRRTPSGRTQGGYVEYAFESGEGAEARTVAGLWWDDADSPVGAYLLAFWTEGVGESWEPMRDVWRRHA